MFVWSGILQNVLKKEGKDSGKPFLIALVDGLEVPFFGYSKAAVDSVEVGDRVKVIVCEGERKGFPSVTGFHICKE